MSRFPPACGCHESVPTYPHGPAVHGATASLLKLTSSCPVTHTGTLVSLTILPPPARPKDVDELLPMAATTAPGVDAVNRVRRRR
jgi:hypothetical protein